MKLNRSQQDSLLCRRARIALRKVDIILKEEGVEAAFKALFRAEDTLKTTSTIRMWIRDYRTMLKAWQSGLVQDVVDEFYTYGFRRALCVAAGRDTSEMKKFRKDYYLACEQTLSRMSERFCRSISDIEAETIGAEALDTDFAYDSNELENITTNPKGEHTCP